jgi:hypothetical protein
LRVRIRAVKKRPNVVDQRGSYFLWNKKPLAERIATTNPSSDS